MDDNWVLRMPWAGKAEVSGPETLLAREWLVTNGLGGYACGTVGGASTRRYHGLLIAALSAPLGRQMMLNHLSELLRLPDGSTMLFGGEERAPAGGTPGELVLHGTDHLTEFRLDSGLPVWHYEVGGIAFEKRVLLPHQQNTVHVNYRLVKGQGTVRLKLRPSVHFRSHDAPVSAGHPYPYRLSAIDNRYELVCGDAALPRLRLFLFGEQSAFTLDGKVLKNILYRVEVSRGYESQGDLWSPGYFRADLAQGQEVTLTASTESWETMLALPPAEALAAEQERHRRLLAVSPPPARKGPGREFVLAADQFLITPAGRVEDAARARAAGDEIRTVIAGYHWFTDWGRDTMISLEGLTLTTGRHAEAGYILRTFAHAIRDGLIPNLFPEGEKEGLYHTADATLWFFHALGRYLDATDDRNTLRLLLPKLHSIIDHHLRGTRFNIKVDPKDGLLSQGAEGYQLTWMDAKVGDWVVTPRRGKAVEINALWYNALRLMEGWVRQESERQGDKETRRQGDKERGGGHIFSADELAEQADRAREAFNRRFWFAEGNYLYDVIDGPGGDDPSCRPNQLFALSLEHPVLERTSWEPVFDVVSKRLLTPVGLRSLAPGSPDYKPRYDGDLRARDAAYHQGTVWAWLIGAYIDVYLKLHSDDARGARRFLDGLVQHLGEACIGSISEIFDAEAPYTPRGCVAQAWSVAETLRCWVRTAGDAQTATSGDARRPEAAAVAPR